MKNLVPRVKRRSAEGVGAVEVAISAGIMIIVAALAVDVTLLNYAFSVNDAACRDAARAAASCQYATPVNGNPNALTAAQTALAMHKTDGVLISQPALTSTTSPDFVYQDYGWNPGPTPPTTSYVTVTTYVTVKLPVPLVWMGNNMANDLTSNGGNLKFIRRYTFPIVHQTYAG